MRKLFCLVLVGLVVLMGCLGCAPKQTGQGPTPEATAAAAYLETEKSFRRIIGYQDLWILKAALDEKTQPTEQELVA